MVVEIYFRYFCKSLNFIVNISKSNLNPYTFAGQFGQRLDEMEKTSTDNLIWQEKL